MRLSSPIYRRELAMVGRLFAQNPALYADIILAAEHLPELIDHYRQTLDLLLAMVRERNRAALIAQFDSASAWFGELAPTLLHESADLLRKAHAADRKSVGSGKSVSVRVDLGGRRINKQKNNNRM